MNISANPPAESRPRLLHLPVLGMALAGSLLLTGCFEGNGAEPEQDTQLFPADGKLKATIRRTTNGVPHVKADNLKSVAFGAGYAQAQDNVCLLADAFVKARSERAKYFGPGPKDINIINDFSYKAQEIRSGAAAEFTNLTDESRALMEGFTDGYNKYVAETDPADMPSECRGQPWVFEISPIDLYAYYRIVGQYASGALFADGLIYAAVPPRAPVDPSQSVAANGADSQFDGSRVAGNARRMAAERTNYTDIGLGSNAWGLGRDMTEQGRGALLANPHFPYTGHRRLYQMQMTVPGYLNVNGAGLLGTAIPFVNFNENLAWSHTVTTSRQFTWYELELKPGDNLTYIKDGIEKPITQKTLQIEVDMGGVEPVAIERTFYFSEYGPMLAVNLANENFPKWGDEGLLSGKPAAYTYRDANASSERLLDSWLQMSRAANLEEFKDVFRNCGTTFWTNSVYADDQGNGYYLDSSSVPNLSEKSIALLNFTRTFSPEFDELFNAGITLLDGSTSVDDWVEGECNGLVSFDKKPQLTRADWVQNSNDSYWATNPEQLLTGYSPLFGNERTPLNPRTRLGITMLQNPLDSGPVSPTATAPGGQDGRFSSVDLINVIYNNRGWFADEFLAELRDRCTEIGVAEVNISDGEARTVHEGCSVLQDWDGVYNTDSVGAHVFRVFIANYRSNFDSDLTVAFNPSAPVATPSTPSSTNRGSADDLMLQALAVGLNALDTGGIAYTAKLGDVQYYQPSGGVPPGGMPMVQADPIPWPGGDGGVIEGIDGGADGGIDGTFNSIGVLADDVAEDTRLPRIAPAIIENTAGLSQTSGEGWVVARGTSFHFGLEFTDNGPVAFGLMSYSQSTDEDSPYFIDQSLRYTEEDYRQLWFAESDIEANLLSQGETTITN
ncbi:penicillin acylase family protein [Marinobacter changyiensis]|uniref:penicillin acylase family protein n=1 Tax=Marinobacter changyiensis TaxID=2604091 RepID=UPI001264F343|nr:penicillin acylase family protein [Marinobacter changyiensis]